MSVVRASLSTSQALEKVPKQPVAITKKMVKQAQVNEVAEELIQTSFRLPRSKWQKLQELSIHERKSVQSILIISLEAEFLKRGLQF